jgi:uncharacterized protein
MTRETDAEPHRHASHPAIVKRLKRAGGHLASIVAMIEAKRPCEDIAQQLHAVEKAIAEAKKTLIRDHLDHCLVHAIETLPDAQKSAVAAFRDITRYL